MGVNPHLVTRSFKNAKYVIVGYGIAVFVVVFEYPEFITIIPV
jgi:hypothetical protein